MQSIPIGLTPFQHEGTLNGILISGRWPESTLEWTQTLVGSVRIACRPGFLPTTTIFGVVEQRPPHGGEDTVGMMVAIGNVVDDSFVEAGRFLNNPPALVIAAPAVADPSVVAGVFRGRLGLCAAARAPRTRTRAPGRVGRGGGRRDRGEPPQRGGHRPQCRPGHRRARHAPRSLGRRGLAKAQRRLPARGNPGGRTLVFVPPTCMDTGY